MLGRAVRQLVDGARVLRALPAIEWGLRRRGARALVEEARVRGRRQPNRSPEERRVLQRWIERFDARMPGGPNCYRRALLMTALDPESAGRPLRFGLRRGGQPASGHVWLSGTPEPRAGTYDVEFEM